MARSEFHVLFDRAQEHIAAGEFELGESHLRAFIANVNAQTAAMDLVIAMHNLSQVLERRGAKNEAFKWRTRAGSMLELSQKRFSAQRPYLAASE